MLLLEVPAALARSCHSDAERQREAHADREDPVDRAPARRALAEEQDQQRRRERRAAGSARRAASQPPPTRTRHPPLPRPALPLEQVHLVDVDRRSVAEDQDHDRQADPDLGGGDGDHEQGEDLAGDVAAGMPRTPRGSRSPRSASARSTSGPGRRCAAPARRRRRRRTGRPRRTARAAAGSSPPSLVLAGEHDRRRSAPPAAGTTRPRTAARSRGTATADRLGVPATVGRSTVCSGRTHRQQERQAAEDQQRHHGADSVRGWLSSVSRPIGAP